MNQENISIIIIIILICYCLCYSKNLTEGVDIKEGFRKLRRKLDLSEYKLIVSIIVDSIVGVLLFLFFIFG